MSTTAKPATNTPTSLKADSTSSGASKSTGQQFIAMALTMSWQLAIVILVPVLAGVALDKAFGTKYVCTLIGLALGFVGMGFVLWRTLQTANSLPVPKLSEAQKKAIRKSYEDEDDE